MLLLADQHGVDFAVLAGTAGDLCLADLGGDDGALRQDVPSDEVLVGRVVGDCGHLDLLRLARLRVGDVGELVLEHLDLRAITHDVDDLSARRPDDRLSSVEAQLKLPLAAAQLEPAAGGLPNRFSLILHNINLE